MSQSTSSPQAPYGEPARPPADPGAPRPLRRTRHDRVFGGVCGGLGRYLGIDPVLLRILAVLLALSGGAGLLAYIIAWVAIPESEDPDDPPLPPRADRPHSPPVSFFAGVAVVVVGALLLMRSILPAFEIDIVGPAVIVLIGLAIIATARSPR